MRHIKKVAVLGSGVMGSRIACHFANAGIEVLLLDMVPDKLNEPETQQGLSLEDPTVRNRIVNHHLAATIKSKPAPLYHKDFISRVSTGNFTDDMPKIAGCDWVMEAVVENLKIKHTVYEQVEQHRKPGTLITSNTSGIPMELLIQGRSDDFVNHFCGTHFFNPPRYLRLFEIIPSSKTPPSLQDFLQHFSYHILGKEPVICKDTPAFIANRIGIFALNSAIVLMQKAKMKVSETDNLTGTLIGRPKSATFRTMDVVGLDTGINVASNLYATLKKDEQREMFNVPELFQSMKAKNMLGSKVGQGFYKKEVGKAGRVFYELNLENLEYEKIDKSKKDPFIAEAKKHETLTDRLRHIFDSEAPSAVYLQQTLCSVMSYAAMRVPEISDELYKIDDAMRAGFGWEMGPFQVWDAIGLGKASKKIKSFGYELPDWVSSVLPSFYKIEGSAQHFFNQKQKDFSPVPDTGKISLEILRKTHLVWQNKGGVNLIDLGDGVLNVELVSKMNAIGAEVMQGLKKALTIAEKDFKGIVIANEAQNFSVGANLMQLFVSIQEGEFDDVNQFIAQFQQHILSLRYSSVPIVAASSGMALGGGCELLLHCDKCVAHAESYIGLVEFGVGLIPAGAGTKEMVLRANNRFQKGDVETNIISQVFETIAMAKVSTSAHEAKDFFFLGEGDHIVAQRERAIKVAKQEVLRMSDDYIAPLPSPIKVLGSSMKASLEAGITGMIYGNYISEHDAKIARKLAHVMTGGNISATALVSETYLIDLEREAFLSLCGERKTQERIHSILFNNKPLRN